MTAAPIDHVLNAILTGQVDDHLEAIVDAVKDRRAIQARVKFHTVKAGDRGVLRNLRPKYLIGAPVTVVDRKQTRIGVRIDPDWLESRGHRDFKYRGVVTVTPDMLELTQEAS